MEITTAVAAPAPEKAFSRCLSFVRLMRLDRSLVAAAYTMLGAYLSGASAPDVSSVARAFLVVLLVVCFGFVINDYRDLETDRAAKPHRPLPAGRVSPSEAVVTALLLAMCALGLAATLDPVVTAIALCALALGACYSFFLKSTLLLGNLAMGVLVGATIPFGALAAGHLSESALAAGALVFLFATSQEVLFNVRDEEGDRLGGQRTTANRLGPKAALRLYRFLLVLTIVLVVAMGFRVSASTTYLLAACACVVAPSAVLFVLVAGPATEYRFRRAVAVTRITWISGVVPLVLLGA